MIDWTKLKSYDTNQNRSFEELCYQIARELYKENGKFTSVDDSGGGDGVEFYLEKQSKEIWGWQAKFYINGRLDSSRKRSIIGSLKKSCEIHPDLKKWFLCVPLDLTPKEKEWFDEVLVSNIPEAMDVELEFWGDSEFNHLISKPELVGKKNYFFGELELNLKWFTQQVNQQLETINEKYNPVLHAETDVDMSIHASLMNDTFVRKVQSIHHVLFTKIKDIKKTIDDLKELKLQRKTIERIVEHYLKSYLKGENSLYQLEEEIKTLQKGNFIPLNPSSCTTYAKEIRLNINETYKYIEEVLTNEEVYGTKELTVEERRSIQDIKYKLYTPIDQLEEFHHEYIKLFELLKKGSYSYLNILGNAGYGKTHLAANISNTQIKKRLPAIFISGKSIMNDQTLSEQIKAILDIPSTYSWSDFLSAVDTAGKVFGAKVPIVIDGLNDAKNIEVVKNGLMSLVYEVNNHENVLLVTTCRSTYIDAFWKENLPENSTYLYGFSSENLRDVVKTYFAYYKINADFTVASLEQFKHPLYLRIFCETENHFRVEEVEVAINDQSIFEIFDSYLEQCNKLISDKLEFNPRMKVIRKKLLNLGKYLWEQKSRFIDIEKVPEILEVNPEEKWSMTIQKSLEDENLLIYKDWDSQKEKVVVSFSYDLLGGFIIANYLINYYKESMQEFINEENTRKLLFDEDYNNNHPLQEDINRCMASLLPRELDKYLFDYSVHQKALKLTVNSWFEISPKLINRKAEDFIEKLYAKSVNIKPLLRNAEKTMRQVNHPLNIKYWSKILKNQSMAERDLFWSEHIRKHQDLYLNVIKLLERKSKKLSLTEYEKKYIDVLAENVMWSLTSTVRLLRDKATKSLYYYGRQFPQKLNKLLNISLEINDSYISERILATIYGVAMARQYDFKDRTFIDEDLSEIAVGLYENMFKSNAIYYTTHVLARDYARKTIEIALNQHPDILTAEQIKEVHNSKSFEWGKFFRDEKAKGSGPLRMDFENYTLGRLVKNRSNYDYDHKDYKNVKANIFWRIYDLGFDDELFDEIDSKISGENFHSRREQNVGKIDRYGKKYSWIAFYELAGYRQDKGMLNDYEQKNIRMANIDIDPSFPESISEYQLIKDNFFDDSIPLKNWIFTDSNPIISSYFLRDEINGEQGPWVLLDGYFSDEDENLEQSLFLYPRGLLVESHNSENLIELLENQDLGGRWIPEIPGDYNVYAGEVPWAETFAYNEETELAFTKEIITEKITVGQEVMVRNGIPLSNEEMKEIIEIIMDKGVNDFGVFLHPQKIDYAANDMLLKENGINIEKRQVETEQKKEVLEKINVIFPVREIIWEEYKSGVIPKRHIALPFKEIATHCELHSRPQTFDLYDKDGKKASIVCEYGEEYKNKQTFTFIRKDLLDNFLESKKLTLIWAVWGERKLALKSKETREKFVEEFGNFRQTFQYVKKYKSNG